MSDEFKEMYEKLGLDEEGNPPPLDPELAACIVTTATGQMIQHPLVHTFHADAMNGINNKALEVKRRNIAKLEGEGKYWPILFVLVERPYRLTWFIKNYADVVGDKEYWSLVGDLWTDTENMWQHRAEWQKLLRSERTGRECMMSEEERAALASLPDEFKVYRGTNAPDRRGAGLSWTLNKKKAEWFARYIMLKGQSPYLLTGRVRKEHVLAHLLGRKEAEIVVLPENVRVLTTQRLRNKR